MSAHVYVRCVDDNVFCSGIICHMKSVHNSSPTGQVGNHNRMRLVSEYIVLQLVYTDSCQLQSQVLCVLAINCH